MPLFSVCQAGCAMPWQASGPQFVRDFTTSEQEAVVLHTAELLQVGAKTTTTTGIELLEWQQTHPPLSKASRVLNLLSRFCSSILMISSRGPAKTPTRSSSSSARNASLRVRTALH